MFRVLVMNETLGERLDATATVEKLWVGSRAGDDLSAEHADGIVDCDVFVLATTSLRQQRSIEHARVSVAAQISDRVRSGGALVCFVDECSPWNPSWLPGVGKDARVAAQALSGKEVVWTGARNAGTPDAAVRPFLESDPSFVSELVATPSIQLISIAVSKGGNVVAGWYRYGRGVVLLLPPMQRTRDRVVAALLRDAFPTLMPDVCRRPVSSKSSRSAPPWVSQVEVPTAAELDERWRTLNEDIQGLERARQDAQSQLDGVLQYRELLWQTGGELETVVRKALALVGAPAEKEHPVDAVHRCTNGRWLYIEIEGSSEAIRVDKGSQLLRYIANTKAELLHSGAPVPEIVGVVIGNPYREAPPDARPPAGAQVGLFTQDLERTAKNEGWRLVTTCQLFEWARRCLGGDTDAVRDARTALGCRC